jgi:hypothetical protein
MGEPWKEHDGHGIVSDWVSRDKAPGELVLNCDGRSKRHYDLKGTLELARKDGWGLGPDDIAKLASKLGRKPTVMADYEHLRAWCNDEWVWQGYTTKITSPDGTVTDGDSCWGYDDGEYMLSEAIASAKSDVDRMILAAEKEQAESHLCACSDIATV